MLDRSNFAGWEKAGGLSMDKVLHAKVNDVLATHQAEPIGARTVKAMDQVLGAIKAKVC